MEQVCAGDSGVEIRLLNDSLQQWEVSIYDWAFDEASPLHKDLKQLSEAADDLVPLRLRIAFPDDYPFAPPLVFCSSPTLASEYVFDGALCMEMCAARQPVRVRVRVQHKINTVIYNFVRRPCAQARRLATHVRQRRDDARADMRLPST